MEKLFLRLSEARRGRVLFDLVVVQTALLAVLALAMPAGQNCVLYGVPEMPRSFGGLFGLSGPVATAHACLTKLGDHALAVELALRVVDDLYALAYGAAGAFAFLWWRHAARRARWPGASIAALSLAAMAMPVAAISDLIENTAVMVALNWPNASSAIAVARFAAAPKYALAVIAAPVLALLALAIWRVARLARTPEKR